MRKNLRATTVLSLLAILLVLPARGLAASQNGISLTPFLQEVRIDPSDVEKSFDVVLTNHTSAVQELNLSTKDFGSLNDTGGVLLEGASGYSLKYGLASWLSLEKDTVVLQPGESATVMATIDNRSSLQPGGHYGAVVASIGSLDGKNDNHVVINQELISLVFADKVGGEHYDLKLSGISHNGNWLHLPSQVHLRFQNPGNVHVVPRGIVQLKNSAGQVLAQGIINTESAYILPETFREIPVQLTTVKKGLPLPGNYQLSVEYRYDGLAKFAVKNQAVFFVNILGYGALLVLLAIGVFIYRKIRISKPLEKSVEKQTKKTSKTVTKKS